MEETEFQSFIQDQGRYKCVVILLVMCSNSGAKLTVMTFKSNFTSQIATTDTFLLYCASNGKLMLINRISEQLVVRNCVIKIDECTSALKAAAFC